MQDSANEESCGGSPSRSRRLSVFDGSADAFSGPQQQQGADGAAAERPLTLDRYSSGSTSLNLARRLVLSTLAAEAGREDAMGMAAGAGAVSSRPSSCVKIHTRMPILLSSSTYGPLDRLWHGQPSMRQFAKTLHVSGDAAFSFVSHARD